ncbi:hypothetical protein EV356DRAFT_258960 [Viridothelium virens]|uniref:Uncharacterized protein n=1 Tax=Viridothelium virens TaxID=1048519 RepID=A0A6A6H295_VIRVR|nr:hypothetical protein EV356DRAFT_258960 [Viridothelium virens]
MATAMHIPESSIEELFLSMQKQVSDLERVMNQRFDRLEKLVLLSTQDRISDMKHNMEKRFDHFEQQLIGRPPRTPGGPKSLDSPPDSNDSGVKNDSVFQAGTEAVKSSKGPESDRCASDPFVNSTEQNDGMEHERTSGNLKFTNPAKVVTLGPEHFTNVRAPNTAMDSPLHDLDISIETPSTTVKSSVPDGEIFPDGTRQLEGPQLESAKVVTESMDQPSPDDLEVSHIEPEAQTAEVVAENVDQLSSDHTEVSHVEPEAQTVDLQTHAKPENESIPAAINADVVEQTSVTALDEASAIASKKEADEPSEEIEPQLPSGGSQQTFCNSPSTDPTMPQNRPNRDDFCYGPTYYALVYGEQHGGSQNDTSERRSSLAAEPLLPQDCPSKDESCSGPSSDELHQGPLTADMSDGTKSQSPADPTMPQHRPNRDDLQYGPTYHALTHDESTGTVNDADELETSFKDPTMPQNRPDGDGLCFGPFYQALVKGITEKGSEEVTDDPQPVLGPENEQEAQLVEQQVPLEDSAPTEAFKADSEPIDALPEPAEASIDASEQHESKTHFRDTSSSSGNDNGTSEDGNVSTSPNTGDDGNVSTFPTSGNDGSENRKTDIQNSETCSGLAKASDDQESALSVEDRSIPKHRRLSLKEEHINSIIEEMRVISSKPRLNPLEIIKKSLAALFAHGNELASDFYQAIDTATQCHKTTDECKIEVLPTSDVANELTE